MGEWIDKKISQIGKVVSGATPSTTRGEFWNGVINWITPSDLSKLTTPFISESERKISEQGLQNCSAQLIPSGNLVLSSRAPIGYFSIVNNDFTTNQGCKSILFENNQYPLFHYYNFLFRVNVFKEKGEGTTFAEISKKAIEKLEFTFPESYQEQKAIAAILLTIDQAIEKTEQLIAKYERIKTGLMQDLLTRGIDEEGRIRSEETHQFKIEGGIKLPISWKVIRLGKFLEGIEQGWSPNCESESASAFEWGVLKTSAVTWQGFFSEENKKLPDGLKPKTNYEIRKGDVLITRAGPNSRVGVVAYVDETRDKLILSDKLYRLYPKKEVLPKYLSIALSSQFTQKHLSGYKTGMAESQTNISQRIILDLKLLLPSIKEQNHIICKLEALDEVIESSRNELVKMYSTKSALMQDILTGKVRVDTLFQKEETP